nr:MAG TPA: hypothetical protein [Inoviridae sp.]
MLKSSCLIKIIAISLKELLHNNYKTNLKYWNNFKK